MALSGPAAIIAIASIACGPARAEVALTLAPNPVPITGFNFGHGMIVDQAHWTVGVTEMAGLGGEIESLTTVVRDIAGQAIGDVTSSDFPHHVNGLDSVAIQQSWTVARDLDNPFQTRRFEVTLRFRDEKGNGIEQTLVAPGAYQ